MDARPIHTEYEFSTAFSGWGREESLAISRVMKTEQFTMAGECEALEHEFAAYHGMKYGIAVNSGSSANLISVAVMVEMGDLERGSDISVPALAWSTTYSPFVQYGMNFILSDCDESWNVRELPQRPNMIVACPILGNPAYTASAHDLAKALDVPLIVDNCESIGARDIDGTLCGTHGILNTFSFYYSHQLSAIEGGMILTNDPGYYECCRVMRSHGWARYLRQSTEFGDDHEFLMHGYNVRPLELHAAIAREQLKKLDQRIAARRANYAHWLSASDGLPIRHPTMRGEPSPFGLHFCVDSRETRQRLANALRAEGIDCRPPVAGSFRLQPYGARWADQQTPNADRIHWTGLMLGCAPFPIPHLIDKAVAVMRRVL